MGATFYEICYCDTPEKYVYCLGIKNMRPELEKKNIPYSKELLNIINLMLEKDKNKRFKSEKIFDMVKKEYEKNTYYSSIDSMIRCLYSFQPLTEYFLQITDNNKPITNAYIDCLKAVKDPNLKAWIQSINQMREILGKKYTILENYKELAPEFIFYYLIYNLHHELNNPKILDNNNNNHFLIKSGENKNSNKIETMIKFVNDFLIKHDSYISNSFMGIIKEIRICNNCNEKTYSFKGYCLITFDLEKMKKNNNNVKINIEEAFKNSNNIVQNINYYCGHCLLITEHKFQKFFFSAPSLLVISIKNGIDSKSLNIMPILDITDYLEFKNIAKKYSLVAVLKREIKNGKEIYFSISLIEDMWIKCQGKNIKEAQFPSNEYSKGDIIMLFYNSVD